MTFWKMGKAPNTPRIKSTTNLSGGFGKLLYIFFSTIGGCGTDVSPLGDSSLSGEDAATFDTAQ